MAIFLNFLLRGLLLAGGVLAAILLSLMFVMLLASWGLRALWFKLTGRPASPFVVRFRAAREFQRIARRARHPAVARRVPIADVTDVEPKRSL